MVNNNNIDNIENKGWSYHGKVTHDSMDSVNSTQIIFSIGNKYFVASQVSETDHGDYETMIFPSTHEGQILSYLELWVVRGFENVYDTIQNFSDGGNYEYDELYGEYSEGNMG